MTENSEILANQSKRRDTFKKNPKLDALIDQLRRLLEPTEALAIEKYTVPRWPVVLVIGNSRSGSTLLTQVLASNGEFSYPSNILNRFAYAPAIGAMIQQMLFNTEYDYLEELSDINSSSNFKSSLGKTDGAMGISEFYHFWRRFVPNFDLGYLEPKDLEKINVTQLRRELAALEAIFNKPFMCKGKAIQYNIDIFAAKMPELFFIHIERDPLYIMQSILQGRRTFYQSENAWFGVKPAEYQELKDMDIYHQIAGQVLLTDHKIHTQLSKLQPEQSIHCYYEDLCANPASFYDRFGSTLAKKGYPLSDYNISETSFKSANTKKLADEELLKLQAAYNELQAHYGIKKINT